MGDVLITRKPDSHAELGYVCPECSGWSPIATWKETEVYCEDCGEHSALQCPLCEEHLDKVFTVFEEPDEFLRRETEQVDSLKRDAESLQQFLKAADDRLRKAKREAAAYKREISKMRAAWVRAVGSRLLSRPDLLVALEETTRDMRLHLDELDADYVGATLVAMEAEYGPHVSAVTVEDA